MFRMSKNSTPDYYIDNRGRHFCSAKTPCCAIPKGSQVAPAVHISKKLMPLSITLRIIASISSGNV